MGKEISAPLRAMRSKSFDESCSSHSDDPRGHSGDDPLGLKSAAAQSSVVSVYHAHIAGLTRAVTVIWNKTLINHSLSLTVETPSAAAAATNSDATLTYKIELKPWPFWSKKGFKSLELGSTRVDLFWDLRSAKFAAGPEPAGGYYVAIVYADEVVLLLGDCKKEAYKRTKSRPSLVDATLLSKRENVFGRKCFSARARFEERKREHDIVVENSLAGPREPEMWISIDGIVLVHVSNLQWKFRGNETVLVERTPVQVFWDVHDWLFGAPGMTHALFIFKPGVPDQVQHQQADEKRPAEEASALLAAGERGGPSESEFCFFLYAWKLE